MPSLQEIPTDLTALQHPCLPCINDALGGPVNMLLQIILVSNTSSKVNLLAMLFQHMLQQTTHDRDTHVGYFNMAVFAVKDYQLMSLYKQYRVYTIII